LVRRNHDTGPKGLGRHQFEFGFFTFPEEQWPATDYERVNPELELTEQTVFQ